MRKTGFISRVTTLPRCFLLGLVAPAGDGLSPAAAQMLDLSGAWSWQSPDPQRNGVDVNTLALGRDGTYVMVSRAPNGWMLRYEGVYKTVPTGPNQAMLQTHVRAWYPTAMCSEVRSMGIRNCGQIPHPSDLSVPVTMLSPTTLDMQGARLARDPNPALLSAQVPAQMMQEMAAPAQPVMPALHPYVTPTLHPYTTPNGPGLAMSRASHQGAQDFINGYMRGCNKDEQGRLWGCEQ